jgi:hypothetical protein
VFIAEAKSLGTLPNVCIPKQNDVVLWNMMHDAWYFSIGCLPDTAKQAIADHLRSANVPRQFVAEFDRIIEFMRRGASTDGFMTRLKINDIDRKRGQNLADVEPELAQLLGYVKTV